MRLISTVNNRIYYLNSFFIIFLENIYRNTCDSTISTWILVLPLIMLARNNVIFNKQICNLVCINSRITFYKKSFLHIRIYFYANILIFI